MANKTVAVIGAGPDRSKYSNKSVRAHQAEGWVVYPVHPHADDVEGLTVYRSIRDVPKPLDRISVYVPPAVGMSLLEDLAAAGAGEVFFNPGSADDALLERARSLGIRAVAACSIVDLGRSPSEFPG